MSYTFKSNLGQTTGIIPLWHWKMNDNADTTTVLDSSNNNDGVAQQNTSSLSTTGKINNSLSFNGTSDCIDVTGITAGTGLTELSFCCWVYNTNQQSNIIVTSNNAIITHFGISNKLAFRLEANDGTNSGYLSYDDYPSINSWVHLCYVWDGSIMRIYINGVQQTTTLSWAGGTNGILDTITTIKLGCFFNVNFDYFKGKIDDIRFYNVALTPDEILGIYNHGGGTESYNTARIRYNLKTSPISITIKEVN